MGYISQQDALWYTFVGYELYLLNTEQWKGKTGMNPEVLKVGVVLKWLGTGSGARAFRPYYLDYSTFFCRAVLQRGLKDLKERGYLETYTKSNDLDKGQYRWTHEGNNWMNAFWTAFDRRMDRIRGRMQGYEMLPYKRQRKLKKPAQQV